MLTPFKKASLRDKHEALGLSIKPPLAEKQKEKKVGVTKVKKVKK